MPNKAQSRKTRLRKRLAKTELDLQEYIKSGLPSGSAALSDVPGVIKAFRALGTLPISKKKRAKLRAGLVESLAKVLAKTKTAPQALGVSDVNDLAELFVRLLERVGYHEYGVNELRRKKSGLRGVFAGELFELLVLNMEDIQKALYSAAKGQLNDLNWAMRRRKAKLINANGENITSAGEWKDIQRVTDIVTYRGNQKFKFTDFAYVAYLDPTDGGPRLVSFLVETEVKLPGAAADFPEQMAAKQARFAAADRVEFIVKGRTTPISFTPDQIVFDRGNINRVALTVAKGPTETWRFRSVREGGHQDIYWRIGLVVDVEVLRSLIDILFKS